MNCFFFPFFSPRSMISFSVSRCIFRFICLLLVGFDERKKNVPPVGTSDVVNFKENEIIQRDVYPSNVLQSRIKNSVDRFFFFFYSRNQKLKETIEAIETAPIHLAVSILSFDLRRVDRSRKNGRGERERKRERGGEAVRRDVTAATRDETC